MTSELTKKVLNYQKSEKTDQKELVNEISMLVYNYPQKRMYWNMDQCSEFYCYFYPRIERLINNFKYCGKDFEAYLNTSLRLQTKSFIKKLNRKKQTQNIYSNPDFWNIKESGITYKKNAPEHHKKEQSTKSLNERDRKRLLYFVLKESTNMRHFNIDDISRITNIDKITIEKLISESSSLLRKKQHKIEGLKKVRNRYFFKIFRLHEEINKELIENNKKQLILELDETKKKMMKTLKNMSSIKMSPTNREIAQLLDIPKGTVDSGFYYLKRSLIN